MNLFIELLECVRTRLAVSPVVCLLGPRQSGKTTLARDFIGKWSPNFPMSLNYFDLEDPRDLARLENPMLALEKLVGLVVIDEVQRAPGLFPILRVLVDRVDNPAKFLILGSASRDLIRQSSETLAGRVMFVEVTPFSASEVGAGSIETLWSRGGFPRAFLATDARECALWREAYIRTFLERDIPALGITIPATTLRRFWLMLTHLHGQILNVSGLASSMSVTSATINRYLDILVGTFMIRRLSPWYENIQKRQLKRPKIYFRDSGILHQLMGISDRSELMTHPQLGASWEGFALEEVIRLHGANEEHVYFWGVHEQMELDLLIFEGTKKLGFEFKYSDTPQCTRSMHQTLELLQLHDHILADRIRAKGLQTFVHQLSRET